MTPILSCTNVRITAPDDRILLDTMDIDLSAGERVAILGPSGAGKTTLLRAILDDLPTGFTRTGSIVLAGGDQGTGHQSPGKTIAYLPQDAGASLTPTMRIGALLREATPVGASSPRRIVEECLDAVQLPSDAAFLRRRPWQLSGGQQRRLALARALARQRPLLILDEPTAALDPETRDHVLTLLARLSEQLSCALLLVTHDLAAAEALHCDLLHVRDRSSSALPDLVRADMVRQNIDPALALRDAAIVDPGGRPVWTHAALDLRPGEITTLRGASGSGKTTIARTLAGLLPLRSGTIELYGASLAPDLRHRTVEQRRSIQLVPQSAHDAFNPRRTIHRSLLDARPVIDPTTLLTDVGLTAELLDRRPHQLSGGQRQRFALIRALSVRPAVLMLDEPTSALDPDAAAQVLAFIRQTADEGATVLLITHDDTLNAVHVDRAVTLRDGALHTG